MKPVSDGIGPVARSLSRRAGDLWPLARSYINVERYLLTDISVWSLRAAVRPNPLRIRSVFLSNLTILAVRADGPAGAPLAKRRSSSSAAV